MSAASVLIATIRDQLHDTIETYRWSDAELLRYLSLGQKQIVCYVPEANAVETVHTISDTSAKRTIPDDGVQFIKVVANASTSTGNAPTGAVTYVEQDQLDRWEPDWRTNAPDPTPSLSNYYQHYSFDRREPLAFWLYPRPTSGTCVRLLYAATPAELSAKTDHLTLKPVFDPALIDYALYRALAKDGRFKDPAKAHAHLASFFDALGIKRKNFKELPAALPPGAD